MSEVWGYERGVEVKLQMAEKDDSCEFICCRRYVTNVAYEYMTS